MLKSDVIAHFGGKQITVARKLGLTKGTISQWGERVPEGIAGRLHVITKGALIYNPADYEKTKEEAA